MNPEIYIVNRHTPSAWPTLPAFAHLFTSDIESEGNALSDHVSAVVSWQL